MALSLPRCSSRCACETYRRRRVDDHAARPADGAGEGDGRPRVGHRRQRLVADLQQLEGVLGNLGELTSELAGRDQRLARLIENPRDELAWFRILQLIESVGPATAGRIMERLEVRRSGGPTPDKSPLNRLIESPPP